MSLPPQLGRLRRIERVGSGGFASVWRYHDDELDSDVAVKALADNWSQRLDVKDRFMEEARILRRADSDHIVRVHDIGTTDSGTPYFVMTYADRGTVADLLGDRKQLPVRDVIDLIGQAGKGLEVLHARGILHRDIKPQNLLLRSSGQGGVNVLIADLGVAKATAQASGLTQVVGTPAYIAPEQAMGLPLDFRADVHSLAAVAYVMLTGRLVREDGLASLIAAKLPEPPSTYAPGVSPAIDRVILKGLAVQPDDRWPDVATFVTALERAGRGDDESPTQLFSQPAGPAPAPEKSRGLAPGWVATWSVAALLVTFVIGYVVAQALR